MATDSARLEAAWIGEIAAGSRAAFERLFHAYEQRLFRYFARVFDDPALAEELVSDTMLDVWKGARRFRGRSRPSTWIFGIAHHKSIDALRRRKRAGGELGEAAAVPDPAPGPHSATEQRSLRHRLREALARLSRKHREVVELTFFHGMSYREIAAVAGCPVSTVKTRMFHAKKQLRPILAAAGLAGGG